MILQKKNDGGSGLGIEFKSLFQWLAGILLAVNSQCIVQQNATEGEVVQDERSQSVRLIQTVSRWAAVRCLSYVCSPLPWALGLHCHPGQLSQAGLFVRR